MGVRSYASLDIGASIGAYAKADDRRLMQFSRERSGRLNLFKRPREPWRPCPIGRVAAGSTAIVLSLTSRSNTR